MNRVIALTVFLCLTLAVLIGWLNANLFVLADNAPLASRGLVTVPPAPPDHTALIQRIIALAQQDGTVAQLPPGRLYLRQQIVLNNPNGGVTIRGAGRAVEDGLGRVKPSRGTTIIFCARNGDSAIFIDHQYDVTIEDLTILGGTEDEFHGGVAQGSKPLGNKHGIYGSAAHFLTLNRVRCSGFDQCGFYLDNCYWGDWRNCQSDFNGTGFQFLAPNASLGTMLTAHYNFTGFIDPVVLYRPCIEANFHDGILFTHQAYSARVHLADPYFEANGLDGNPLWSHVRSIEPVLIVNIDGVNQWYRGAQDGKPLRDVSGQFLSFSIGGAPVVMTDAKTATYDMQSGQMVWLAPFPLNWYGVTAAMKANVGVTTFQTPQYGPTLP